jgi:hypothetical protein
MPKRPVTILKIDEPKQQVFGYFNVAVRSDGELITDLQGDIITPDELEKAAYEFVLESREGGEMHKGAPVSTLIESFVITPDKLELMDLKPGPSATVGWWGAFQIHDAEVFKRVTDGELTMFSIEGEGERVEA